MKQQGGERLNQVSNEEETKERLLLKITALRQQLQQLVLKLFPIKIAGIESGGHITISSGDMIGLYHDPKNLLIKDVEYLTKLRNELLTAIEEQRRAETLFQQHQYDELQALASDPIDAIIKQTIDGLNFLNYPQLSEVKSALLRLADRYGASTQPINLHLELLNFDHSSASTLSNLPQPVLIALLYSLGTLLKSITDIKK